MPSEPTDFIPKRGFRFDDVGIIVDPCTRECPGQIVDTSISGKRLARYLDELAAIYAVIIAVGHVFNDANKRTAFMAMDTCLRRNDVVLEYDMETMGHMIVEVVQGLVDETELARYLRTVPTKEG